MPSVWQNLGPANGTLGSLSILLTEVLLLGWTDRSVRLHTDIRAFQLPGALAGVRRHPGRGLRLQVGERRSGVLRFLSGCAPVLALCSGAHHTGFSWERAFDQNSELVSPVADYFKPSRQPPTPAGGTYCRNFCEASSGLLIASTPEPRRLKPSIEIETRSQR